MYLLLPEGHLLLVEVLDDGEQLRAAAVHLVLQHLRLRRRQLRDRFRQLGEEHDVSLVEPTL